MRGTPLLFGVIPSITSKEDGDGLRIIGRIDLLDLEDFRLATFLAAFEFWNEGDVRRDDEPFLRERSTGPDPSANIRGNSVQQKKWRRIRKRGLCTTSLTAARIHYLIWNEIIEIKVRKLEWVIMN